MSQIGNDQIRQNVRSLYKEIALQPAAAGSGCCAPPVNRAQISEQLGYSDDEMASVPEGANLGLGCGNPQAIAALQTGEVVLDLGSGGGFDCFLAARQVGDSGRVIGVDMTPEMISRARANAERAGLRNIEFRLGEIEHLPVADQSADVIISNCVINLSPAKQQVFDEAFRVLRAGGRLAVSDVVATAELPQAIREDVERLYAGCISGASSIDELQAMLARSGFVDIRIEPRVESRAFIKDWAPGTNAERYLASAAISAVKPPASS